MKPVKYKLRAIMVTILGIAISLCFITIIIAQTEKEKSNDNIPKQELKITAQVDKDKTAFKIGEVIVINLTVKNNDDVELFVHQSCATLDYKLTVKDEYGQLVSLTKEGQRRTNRYEMICPSKKVQIEPGKSKQDNINLTQLYDLSATGKYYVSVNRSARKGEYEWINLESDVIQIVVE
jgi:hypothetical protein